MSSGHKISTDMPNARPSDQLFEEKIQVRAPAWLHLLPPPIIKRSLDKKLDSQTLIFYQDL